MELQQDPTGTCPDRRLEKKWPRTELACFYKLKQAPEVHETNMPSFSETVQIDGINSIAVTTKGNQSPDIRKLFCISLCVKVSRTNENDNLHSDNGEKL